MASIPKIAVLGTGSLGKEHARIYADMHRSGRIELAGVYDAVAEVAAAVAAKSDCARFESIEEAVAAADAFSVVTPTVSHHAVTVPLLRAGKHVLIEKPMTHTTAQAAELIELARARDCVLQVGHIERFNPVFDYLERVARDPRFIEAHRLSPYPARSTDIGVVMDLMIHDLDVVLAFVKSPVASVDAVGIPVLSDTEDIANARIRFENGCVANLTASRISPERLRKIRVFSSGPQASYISLDYRAQEGFAYRMARADERESSSLLKALFHGKVVSEFAGKRIVREPVPIIRDEPLKLELESFVNCIDARQTPRVSGETAKMALDLAFDISTQIKTGFPPATGT